MMSYHRLPIEWIGTKLRNGYSPQAREREAQLNRPRLGLSEQQVQDKLRPPKSFLVGAMRPRDALAIQAEESLESLQRASDFVYALHVLDEIGRDTAWRVAGGDGRW
jgi:hypothetical protein